MWFLPKKESNLVTISCSPTTIACAWITPVKEKAPYALKAYRRIPIERLELAQGYVHNPTQIDTYIASFLAKHNLQNACIALALRGPTIYETIATTPSTVHDPSDSLVPKKQQHIWSYRYLYSQDTAQATFYICSISQALLFQYKLCALRQKLNLIGITTTSMAYLHAYTHAYGVAFRHSQLARDMSRCNNSIDQLVPSDIIRRRLIVPSRYTSALDHELSSLTPLLGLAMSQTGF